jgi:hypothetical protein
MEEKLLLLKRIILVLVGGGAVFLTLFMALFTWEHPNFAKIKRLPLFAIIGRE